MADLRKSDFSVDIRCYKCKKEALQCISRVEGVDMVKVDMEKKMITVEGEADPTCIAKQLRRKFKCARLVFTGPYKPPSKEGPKKDEKKTTGEEKTKGQKNEIKEKKGETKAEEKKGNGQPAENKNPKEKKEDDKKPVQKKEDAKKQPVENVSKGDNRDKREIRCCPHYPPCTVHHPCHNPQYCCCSACSRRSDILWPRCHPSSAPPAEVWYVLKEETPSYCTIC